MRLCCAWLLWEHPYSEAGLNLVVFQVGLFVELNFGLFLVFCKEGVGVCRQVPKQESSFFLLGALLGFQVSKLGWILTVKKAPGASWVSSLTTPVLALYSHHKQECGTGVECASHVVAWTVVTWRHDCSCVP